MIHVVAIITAKPGQRAALLGQFTKILPIVHAEAGCIQYEPLVDTPDILPGQVLAGADTFIVVERWESAETLRAHAAATHMAEYHAKTADITASVAVHVMRPVVPPAA